MTYQRVGMAVLLGCTPPASAPDTGDAVIRPPGAGAPQVAAVACTDPGHPLRRRCEVQLGQAAALEWTWTEPGGSSRSRTTPHGTTHVVEIGLLIPDAIYVIEARDDAGNVVAEGSFDADGLPDAMRLDFDVSGVATAPYVVFPFGCAGAASHVVVATSDGVVVGYEDVAVSVGFLGERAVRGLTDNGDGSLLVIVGNEAIVSWDPERGVTAQWASAEGTLPAVVHHDALQKQGLLWALTASVATYGGREYVMDGVVAVDEAGGVMESWGIGEVLVPDGSGQASGYWADRFPGAVDFVHANSLSADEDGGLLLSLHKEDAVLRLDGALQADWLLVGSPSSALAPGDLVLSGSGGIVPTFRGQHHVTAPESGALWMLDNEGSPDGARVLVFALTDGAAGAVEERPTGLVCPGQGSATRLPNGNAVVDCSAEATFLELPASGPAAWQMTARCAYGLPTDDTVYRALPFTPP